MKKLSISDLTAQQLVDDIDKKVSYEYSVPTSSGTFVEIVVPNHSNFAAKGAAIRGVTTLMPARGATNIIASAEAQSGPPVPQTARTGWKISADRPVAFALPHRVIDLAGTGMRWNGKVPDALTKLGFAKGNCAEFRSRLLPLSDASRHISFVVMAALGAPVVRIANLPESPLFAFFGPSSVGKTTLLRIAAAVQGSPDAMLSWDATPRALEEAAFAANDLMLILNAAERCSPKRQGEVLQRITHSMTEGVSTLRSSSVQDQFRDLTWKSVTLTSSNESGRQLATRLQLPWKSQDEVRFIDIPVADAEAGGIFDMLPRETANLPTRCRDLVDDVESLIAGHCGVLIEPWIRYLGREITVGRVNKLMDRFLKKVSPSTGVEERIARKFALIYAAGKIANEDAQLLGWPRVRTH